MHRLLEVNAYADEMSVPTYCACDFFLNFLSRDIILWQ